MAYSVDMDDFSGKFCNAGKYPLLNALNSALRIDTVSTWSQEQQNQDEEKYDDPYSVIYLWVTIDS